MTVQPITARIARIVRCIVFFFDGLLIQESEVVSHFFHFDGLLIQKSEGQIHIRGNLKIGFPVVAAFCRIQGVEPLIFAQPFFLLVGLAGWRQKARKKQETGCAPCTPAIHQSAHTQRGKAAAEYRHSDFLGRKRRQASDPRSRVMAPTKLAKQTRKVAPQNAAAAHRLAGWYGKGEEGLSHNTELALTWERQAADLGCADAQCQLGASYYYGATGLPVDHAIAFAWFRKAALQGRAFPT
jgi:hypothetical protein